MESNLSPGVKEKHLNFGELYCIGMATDIEALPEK
jgi:hypothetical protein